MATIAQQIVGKFLDRLRAILIADGYNTDMGATVKHDRVDLEHDDNRLTVFAEAEVPAPVQSGGRLISARLQVLIEAKIPVPDGASDTAAGDLVEALVEDIQRAVEQPDQTFGGLAPGKLAYLGRTTTPRYPSAQELGPRSAHVRVLYSVGYNRRYGNPSEKI